MGTHPEPEHLVSESFTGHERRSEPRVAVNVAARLKSLNPLTSTGPSTRASIIEISHSGMRVRSNRHFQVGTLVHIITPGTFYLGTIRHCSPAGEAFEVGIKLTERIPSSLV